MCLKVGASNNSSWYQEVLIRSGYSSTGKTCTGLSLCEVLSALVCIINSFWYDSHISICTVREKPIKVKFIVTVSTSSHQTHHDFWVTMISKISSTLKKSSQNLLLLKIKVYGCHIRLVLGAVWYSFFTIYLLNVV